MLLFVYIFGGAIRAPGLSYVDYLLPGIVVQTRAVRRTAVALAADFASGMDSRFRTLPIARSAVLAGRTLADVNIHLSDCVPVPTWLRVCGKFRLTGSTCRAAYGTPALM